MSIEAQPDGIYQGIPWEEYAAWPVISYSSLKWLVPPSTPRQFLHRLLNPTEPTPAMRAGSLIDCLLLEPEAFATRYSQRPQWPNAGCTECMASPLDPCVSVAKGKQKPHDRQGPDSYCDDCGAFPGEPCRRPPLKVAHGGRWDAHVPTGIEITSRQQEDALRVVNEILDHPTAGPLVRESSHQVSMIWTDLETGIRIKGRIDMLRPGLIADLKTAKDASPEGWPWVVGKYGYHLQAAGYLEGYSLLTGRNDAQWLWLAVEIGDPIMIGLHSATEGQLSAGEREWHAALRLYAHCKEEGCWPGYPIDPVPCYPTPRMIRGNLADNPLAEDETAPEFPWDEFENHEEEG